jgi:hypothetical protein
MFVGPTRRSKAKETGRFDYDPIEGLRPDKPLQLKLTHPA